MQSIPYTPPTNVRPETKLIPWRPHVYVVPLSKNGNSSRTLLELTSTSQKSIITHHIPNMSPSPSEIPAPLVHIVASISALINLLSTAFHKIPGSPIIIRYIRSSYQNDPWRSLLEVLLVAFALRTVLKGRTRGDGQSKSFIKFSDKVCRPSVIERSEIDADI